MDIQDISNLAKNGTQIIPQFTPPNGEYLINKKNDKTLDISDGYKRYATSNNRTHHYEVNGKDYNADDGWTYLKNNEDLPEFADKKVQNMTMLYNALEALKNRNFQERMYGERYQKIIKDIQKAGLNPYAINFFTPSGGFSGSSASIMSNYQAQQSNIRSNIQSQNRNFNKSNIKSENYNFNKKVGGIADLIPILTTMIGATLGGPLGALLGGIGGGGASALIKRIK